MENSPGADHRPFVHGEPAARSRDRGARAAVVHWHPDVRWVPQGPEVGVRLRNWIAAFNRRDAHALIALADPEIVNHPPLTRTRYIGHSGLCDWMRDVRAKDDRHTITIRDVRELDAGHWIVLGELFIEDHPLAPVASIVRVRGGLITEARAYLSDERILRDIGHIP